MTSLEVNAAFTSVSNIQKFMWSINYGAIRQQGQENRPVSHSTLAPNFKTKYLSEVRREVHERIIAVAKVQRL